MRGGAGKSEMADSILTLIDQLNAEFAQEARSNRAFSSLLERIVEITDSEYGFIGEFLDTPDGSRFLKCYSVTDKALAFVGEESRKKLAAGKLEFHALDKLFGPAVLTGERQILNDIDPTGNDAFLASPHPPLDSFLGLPLLFGGQLVGMVGVANRPGGYSCELADVLSPLMRNCGTLIGIRRAETEVDRMREVLFEAINSLREGFAIFDTDDRLFLANTELESIFPKVGTYLAENYTFEEILRDSIRLGQINRAGASEVEQEAWIRDRLETHRKAAQAIVQPQSDGRWLQVEERRTPSGRVVGVWTDITESKRTEQALRMSEEKFRSLYELAPVGIAMCSPDGRFIDGNQAFLKMVERSKVDVHGLALAEMLGEPNWFTLETQIGEAGGGQRFGPVELDFNRPDGESVNVLATGMVAPVVSGNDIVWLIMQDVSERKRAASVVWHAEHHDMLTNLPNRAYLNDFIAGLRVTGGEREKFGFLLLGLDNFKAINDVFGHVAGDVVLSKIAGRLRQYVREGDFIARLGGDEFALVVRGAHSRARLTKVADRILKALRRKILYRGHPLYCQGSIGVASFPEHGRTAPELIRSADIALYSAKKNGRNRAYIFDPDLLRETEVRYEAVAFVRQALGEGRVVPAYQPKIDIRTGRLIGFEALVRVRDKNGDVLGPGSFAEAFDEPELLSDIDQRMLDLVTTDLRLWQEHGVDVGRIAVNASNNELWSGDYADRVFSVLDSKGIPFDRLQIEVTETAFLGGDFNTVAQTLERLSSAGVTVALDDFGTGYASLTHLKTLPVSRVKIDRSFVYDITTNDVSRTIVETIIKLCRGLGKVVIAEGIETKEQLAVLHGFGCDHGQGFYFAKPLLREDVNLFILRSFGYRMRSVLHAGEEQESAYADDAASGAETQLAGTDDLRENKG